MSSNGSVSKLLMSSFQFQIIRLKSSKTKSDIKCLIIGNGPEEESLKKLVRTLKLQKNIKFYNFLPKHRDLYSLIKSSKAFVLPSSREGFGLAAIESQALGI